MSPKKMKRWNILIDLLRDREHVRGAEIGVFEGDTSVRLLQALPALQKLICVDPFIHYPDQTKTLKPHKKKFHGADYDTVQHTFEERMQPYKDRYMLLRMFSRQAVYLVPDNLLDFVFIDGNHAYEYVKQDIDLWKPKLKLRGILAGHDYGIRGYNNSFGVTKAVKDTFGTDYDYRRHVWWHVVK